MPYWSHNPELFLYAKGTGSDDVQLWKCKRPMISTSSSSSSQVVPMKPDDFDPKQNVTDYLDLLGTYIRWDETDYKKLVKYISERRLLVNIQGLVIAEIYKLDDANKVPIYIRSLDVLDVTSYLPKVFMERPVPSRTVQVLEDVNGKAAMMEKGPNVPDVTKLTAKIADLESKNKTLETNVTNLTSGKIDDLESKNKTLEDKVAKLTADLANLQRQLDRSDPNIKEVWMNNLTNSEWVGIGGLTAREKFQDTHLFLLGDCGTFRQDDSTTNVKAIYWSKVKLEGGSTHEYKVILLEDLTPNEEKARFSQQWGSLRSKGTRYACQYINQ